jgi:hypothetical protein
LHLLSHLSKASEPPKKRNHPFPEFLMDPVQNSRHLPVMPAGQSRVEKAKDLEEPTEWSPRLAPPLPQFDPI